jgi:hypothetical protein
MTAAKAGEVIVTAGSYVDGFFTGLSQFLESAANNLENNQPILPLIEEEAKSDEASTSSPSVPLVQTDAPRVNDNKYMRGDKLLVTGDSRKYERDIFPEDIVIFERMGTMANVDDPDDIDDVAAYVVKRLNDDREYYLPVVGSVTLTKKGGSRKQRRKTLRRKK